jgi:hypothetical protein
MSATATTAAGLAEVQPYPGPAACFDEPTGTIWIGRYPGGSFAPWQLYRPGWGACGGIVTGCTGSGVSTLLDGLGRTAAHSGLASVWTADPLDGGSLPGAAGYADWRALGDVEILRMLRAAHGAMTTRLKINAVVGRAVHPITGAAPMILVVVDEGEQVFTASGAEATELAARIVRAGRKAGVGLAVGVREPWPSAFGGSEALRTALVAGNVVALRAASAAARRLFPPSSPLGADPAGLPRLPGVGLVAGHRADAFRVWWPGDTGGGDPAEPAPEVPVEPAVAAVLGEDYASRSARLAAHLDAIRAEVSTTAVREAPPS